MQFRLGPDVDTAGRLVYNQDLGLGGQPLGNHHALLVATAQIHGVLVYAWGADGQILHITLGQVSLSAGGDHAEAGKEVQLRHADIGHHGLGQDKALFLAILGHQTDACRNRLTGCADVDPFAVDTDLTPFGDKVAKKGAGQFGAACADQSRQAKDLASVQIEADILKQPALGQATNL